MGCGCGGTSKQANVTYDYIHVDTTGQQHTYTNEYEARAAVLREGGSWRAEPRTTANA